MKSLNILSFFLFSFFLLKTIAQQPLASSSKRFIFRFDDVEDFFHSSSQVEIMNYFMDNSIGVSVGIIGDYVNGQDAALFTALLRCTSLSPDKCALFNHGSNAEYIFGDAVSVAEAKDQIQRCDTKIKTLFSGYSTQLFCPHQNSWNAYAQQAVVELGYDAISASELQYSGMNWNLTSRPLQMPEQTTTAGFVQGSDPTLPGSWIGVPVSQTVADCNAAAARGEVCVIMSHPHEFALGTYTLDNLKVSYLLILVMLSYFLLLFLRLIACFV
jgi:hypothetical protein